VQSKRSKSGLGSQEAVSNSQFMFLRMLIVVQIACYLSLHFVSVVDDAKSRASVCLSVCPRPHAHTIDWPRCNLREW